MDSINKWLTPLGTLLTAALLVVVLVGGNQSASFGGSSDSGWNATNSGSIQVDGVDVIDADGDLKIGGASASSINRINASTCHLWVGTSTAQTIAASSTVAVDCQATNGLATQSATMTALTGVTTDDSVFVSAPTTTPHLYNGLNVIGVNASSTPGYITIKFANLTGGTFTFGTTSAYGWHYMAVDDN